MPIPNFKRNYVFACPYCKAGSSTQVGLEQDGRNPFPDIDHSEYGTRKCKACRKHVHLFYSVRPDKNSQPVLTLLALRDDELPAIKLVGV